MTRATQRLRQAGETESQEEARLSGLSVHGAISIRVRLLLAIAKMLRVRIDVNSGYWIKRVLDEPQVPRG